MRVELITTGTELLLGRTLNTHVRFVAESLFPLGLRLERQTAIPDGDGIRQALQESFGRCDLLIVTGGLGPTSDDLTREITAELLGRELVLDEASAAWIRSYYEARGRGFDPGGRRQAMAPRGAEVLPNPQGTAPGLFFAGETGRPPLFLLPGPPRELYPMFAAEVRPRIEALLGGLGDVECREWVFAGLGESDLAERLAPVLLGFEGLEVGYCAGSSSVRLRGIGRPELLEKVDAAVVETFPYQAASSHGETMEEVVVGLLKQRGEWVSAAESCTGGLIAHRLTNVPGASAVLGTSFVTYANEAKTGLLGVSEALLRERGAVSPETAEAMAQGCLAASGADWALAVTGIAGPSGGSAEKPVGTVWIAVAGKGLETVVRKGFFPVDRETFKLRASEKALDLLRRRMLGFPS